MNYWNNNRFQEHWHLNSTNSWPRISLKKILVEHFHSQTIFRFLSGYGNFVNHCKFSNTFNNEAMHLQLPSLFLAKAYNAAIISVFMLLTKQAFLVICLSLGDQRNLHLLEVHIKLKKVVPDEWYTTTQFTSL